MGKVGGGDSLVSDFIYNILNNKKFKEALEFGITASALKHTVHGDFSMATVGEVEKLLQGNVSGRVQSKYNIKVFAAM